jgi:hypothetical protein
VPYPYSMKIRIGQLLDKINKLESRTNRIESKSNRNELKKTKGSLESGPPFDVPLERPQTAQLIPLYNPILSKVEEELDMDIQGMLERNRKQLQELKHDMEEVKNVRPQRKKI